MEEIIDNLTVPQLKKRLNTAAVVRRVWAVIMFLLILWQAYLVWPLQNIGQTIGCILLFGTICIYHLVINTAMTRLKLNLCAVAILLLPFANCAYHYFCSLLFSTAIINRCLPPPCQTTNMFPFMLDLMALFLLTSIFSSSALLMLLFFRKTFLNYHKLIKRRDEYVAVCLKDCGIKHLKRMLAIKMVFNISVGVFAVSFLTIIGCGALWKMEFAGVVSLVLLVPLLAIFTAFIALLFNLFERRNICPFAISLPVLKNAIKEQQNTGDWE